MTIDDTCKAMLEAMLIGQWVDFSHYGELLTIEMTVGGKPPSMECIYELITGMGFRPVQPESNDAS